MYYFERGRFNIPLFWRENGIPFFFGNTRVSRRKIVWWMPTNWVAFPLILLIWLPVLAWRLARAAAQEKGGG
ncbi:hypothetical protein [Gemmobacter sp. 24YEA27]|uniref:hypothetical protein n=1 Tax=Gemmobacter sp. 24YEA27 TaxID=3040672 RepID=UPI0024B32A79|nr:hypothetical protein [Gemmobacter sp. 24YEA27]